MHFKIHIDSETNGQNSRFGSCFWTYVIEGDSSSLNGPSSANGTIDNDTINRSLLVATIEALKLLPPDCEIAISSPHEYLTKSLNFGLPTWPKTGWRTKGANGRRSHQVKHIDLWKEIADLLGNLQSVNGRSFRRTQRPTEDASTCAATKRFYRPGFNSFRKKSLRAWPHAFEGLAFGRCQAMLSLPQEMNDEDRHSLKKLLLEFAKRRNIDLGSAVMLAPSYRGDDQRP